MPQPICAIVGAGEGLGSSLAAKFAGEGFDIALISRSEKGSSAAAKAAAGANAEVTVKFFAADATQPETIERALAKIVGEMGEVDVLIYNVRGNFTLREPLEMTYGELEEIYRLEVVGAFAAAKSVLPAMRERQDGLIVNISSVAGKRASLLGGVAYSASKFAMTALGTTVGLEDATNGIRVTNVYPGEVNTPILDKRPVKVSDEHRRQILQPEDVAAAVLMIARLPPRAHVAELVIKPTSQAYC